MHQTRHRNVVIVTLDYLRAGDGKRWADQGLNIDVPAIPAGLAAFTQSQDV
jgi:hypothetical protein